MSELPLIFIGGLLGSSHCLGMCGGFAIMLGSGAESRTQLWMSQGVYSLGRLFTYASLGAIAGFVGLGMSRAMTSWINVSAVLSIVAGTFLVTQGLKAAGVQIWKTRNTDTSHSCLMSPLFRTFFQSHRYSSKFLAGVMTGFLPCGLLYGFLAIATASQDLLLGSAIMLAFGAGTIPMMVLTGVGGQLLSAVARIRLLRVAAWCVVVTGAITVYRGAAFYSFNHSEAVPDCPFCDTSAQ
ncbi:sulfite exporter TauE/SafE family protein [Thalassoglobus sp. JC818]|uniref:sulfite exporter TauE/SafE family protein n=1 Tax=Thalassoglobus sp. JC818 TaxID=3232136 RepID=UPI00345765A9